MDAARRIGEVHVDHGETGCKTPDAAAYIQKMADRAAKKATTKEAAAKEAAAKPKAKAASKARRTAPRG